MTTMIFVRENVPQTTVFSLCGVKTFYTSPQQEAQKAKRFFMLTFLQRKSICQKTTNVTEML